MPGTITCAVVAASAILASQFAAPVVHAAPPTRGVFQKQVTLTCLGGVCSAIFVDLPGTQALEVERIVCHFSSAGANAGTYSFTANFLSGGQSFSIPLSPTWQRQLNEAVLYTLATDVAFRVPRGQVLWVSNTYLGSSPSGYCIVVGEILTYS